MNLNILWFVLIAVLYTGFFILEGFDFGIGILLPFVGKNDIEKRVIINTIGPLWDANEVWLVLAGGATFAAFPQWYATLFSGFYLPLLLVLVALILRGVSFEFRGKFENAKWRSAWDACTFVGSLLPPVVIWNCLFEYLERCPNRWKYDVYRRLFQPIKYLCIGWRINIPRYFHFIRSTILKLEDFRYYSN